MKITITLALIFLLSGCATITRGTSQPVAVTTDPPGAEARAVSENIHCTTPCSLTLSRRKIDNIEFTKDGYETQSLQIAPHSSGAGLTMFLGNILLGGIVGIIVDMSTGAGYDLGPNPANAALLKVPALNTSSNVLSDVPVH